MAVTLAYANKLYRRAVAQGTYSRAPAEMRDWVDQQTGGELDTTQLDLLTEWVSAAEARINRRHRAA